MKGQGVTEGKDKQKEFVMGGVRDQKNFGHSNQTPNYLATRNGASTSL